jgi:hypothetical protein
MTYIKSNRSKSSELHAINGVNARVENQGKPARA